MHRRALDGITRTDRALVAGAPPPPADNTWSQQRRRSQRLHRAAPGRLRLPDIRMIPPLGLAAQRYARDLVSHPELGRPDRLDGSTPQSRSAAAGYPGRSARPSRSMRHWPSTPRDAITQWYHDPAAWAIMSDCANTAIGVWSENSLDRSVVVVVTAGRPSRPTLTHLQDDPGRGRSRDALSRGPGDQSAMPVVAASWPARAARKTDVVVKPTWVRDGPRDGWPPGVRGRCSPRGTR